MDEVWLYWVFGGKLESRRGVLEYIDDVYGLISNCTREDDREKAIDIFVEYYLKKVMKARTDLTAKEMIYETVCTLREKEKE